MLIANLCCPVHFKAVMDPGMRWFSEKYVLLSMAWLENDILLHAWEQNGRFRFIAKSKHVTGCCLEGCLFVPVLPLVVPCCNRTTEFDICL